MQGFKSFADKTELNFDKDIFEYKINVDYNTKELLISAIAEEKTSTVEVVGNKELVVGENIYKIKVLGEQSVKTLRGEDKMSDIIFSGSKTRDALTKASVSILFDNNDHTLNCDFNDVEIKRVIYKTGENEY